MLDPLTLERMAAKAGDAPIVIALSGGGDSTALLHLLVESFGASRFRAVVVDHALREGSAQDAQRAASFAEKLGVTCSILTIDWREYGAPASRRPQPAGEDAGAPYRRSQDVARRARYQALCNHARGIGARIVAVAHTADDQAETILMRAAAGSSWRGLAGIAPIAPAPIWPEGRGLMLARPLLNVRRTALREDLRQRAADWIEDPANTNEAFERVRVRARLAELEVAGFKPMRLVRVAEKLRGRMAHLDHAAAALIERAARFEEDRVVIARAAWQGGKEVRQRALSVLIAAAAGAQREPSPAPVARLEHDAFQECFRGASLGGAGIARRGGDIVLERDRGALAGRADGAAPIAPLPLAPNVTAVWDGRVELSVREPGWSVVFEDNAPRLANGEKRAALAAAVPHYLLKARVQHALSLD